jgi:hypothetical protein
MVPYTFRLPVVNLNVTFFPITKFPPLNTLSDEEPLKVIVELSAIVSVTLDSIDIVDEKDCVPLHVVFDDTAEGIPRVAYAVYPIS